MDRIFGQDGFITDEDQVGDQLPDILQEGVRVKLFNLEAIKK